LTADRGRGLARKAIDSPADPARADRDLLVTRLGHAAAGVCFATIAIPATVLVARTPVQRVVSAPDPRVTERLATLDRERQALGEQVGTLDAAVPALATRSAPSAATCRVSARGSIRPRAAWRTSRRGSSACASPSCVRRRARRCAACPRRRRSARPRARRHVPESGRQAPRRLEQDSAGVRDRRRRDRVRDPRLRRSV